MDLTFTNARLVLENEVISGVLGVRDGRIADVGGGNLRGQAVDCEGDYLIPALFEEQPGEAMRVRRQFRFGARA